MSKFAFGTKVCYIGGDGRHYGVVVDPNDYADISHINLTSDAVWAIWDGRPNPSWMPEHRVLLDDRQPELSPVDAAVQILEKAGYTVTPPAPLLTGEVVIFQAGGPPMASVAEKFDHDYAQRGYKVLARLPWTEGQGL